MQALIIEDKDSIAKPLQALLAAQSSIKALHTFRMAGAARKKMEQMHRVDGLRFFS